MNEPNRRVSWTEAIHEAIVEELGGEQRGCLFRVEGADDRSGADLLAEELGEEFVCSAPAEARALLGLAAGAARAGLRCILEAPLGVSPNDLLGEISRNVATAQYYTAGKVKLPLLIRCVIGDASTAGDETAACLTVPGLHVALPSCAHDAKALAKTALRCHDPVLLLEPHSLLDVPDPVPTSDVPLPFAKAALLQSGADATVVAIGAAVAPAAAAAAALAADGIHVDLIDPRTLAPLDLPAIAGSLAKTGRLVVVESGRGPVGVGAEILARAAEECFDEHDAPPRRVTTSHVPNAPAAPDADAVIDAIRASVKA